MALRSGSSARSAGSEPPPKSKSHFADSRRFGDQALEIKLLVVATNTFRGLCAEWYLGTDSPREAWVMCKRLERSYFWSIRGADFGSAGNQILPGTSSRGFRGATAGLDRINGFPKTLSPAIATRCVMPGRERAGIE